MRFVLARTAVVGVAIGLLSFGARAADEQKLYDKSLIYGIDFKYGRPPADRLAAVRQAMFGTATEHGATITRAGISWAGVEPARGQAYDWEKPDGKAGGGPYFDAISMHSYGRPFNFGWIRAVRKVMVNNGDAHKPIWITEYGLNWQRSDGVSEEAKAALMRAALRYLWETPWLTMGLIHHATPIMWTQDPEDLARLIPRAALIAFKETRQEAGPASAFRTSFEDDWDLTYWYYELGGGWAAFPPVTLTNEAPHGGKQCLRAHADGNWVQAFGGVNVKAKSPTLSFWFRIVPADPPAKAKLSVEVRPDSLDSPAQTLPILDDAPIDKWACATFLSRASFRSISFSPTKSDASADHNPTIVRGEWLSAPAPDRAHRSPRPERGARIAYLRPSCRDRHA